MQDMQFRSLGQEDALEEGMATHSSILAWALHGSQGSLVGYSAWGRRESDTTEQLGTPTCVQEVLTPFSVMLGRLFCFYILILLSYFYLPVVCSHFINYCSVQVNFLKICSTCLQYRFFKYKKIHIEN